MLCWSRIRMLAVPVNLITNQNMTLSTNIQPSTTRDLLDYGQTKAHRINIDRYLRLEASANNVS